MTVSDRNKAHAARRHMRHAFLARSVAECYACRPPYSDEVYTKLRQLLAEPRVMLDAGCGPGKLARGLVAEVDRVDAIDPSEEMLRTGRALPGGADPKLHWIQATIEEAPLNGPYGLIAAGASFHWFDPDVALSRFADVLARGAVLVLLDGDAAWNAPWEDAEIELMYETAEHRTGVRPDFRRFDPTHPLGFEHPQFEPRGVRVTAPHPFEQSVEEYLLCQHSRASLSLETLGGELAAAFDASLREILAPYAVDGRIRYDRRTRLEWGLPKHV